MANTLAADRISHLKHVIEADIESGLYYGAAICGCDRCETRRSGV